MQAATIFSVIVCLAIAVRTILMGLSARKTDRDFFWIFYLVNGGLCLAIAIVAGLGFVNGHLKVHHYGHLKVHHFKSGF